MTFMLRKLATHAHTVVAVVGAGHLAGIRWVLPLPAVAANVGPVLCLLGSCLGAGWRLCALWFKPRTLTSSAVF